MRVRRLQTPSAPTDAATITPDATRPDRLPRRGRLPGGASHPPEHLIASMLWTGSYLDAKGRRRTYRGGIYIPRDDEPTRTQDSAGVVRWNTPSGALHNEDGPAIEHPNGDKEYFINGLLHREDDLPAREMANGTKEWFVHGKRHRNGDQPAIVRPDGTEEYWFEGKRHRGGNKPALRFPNGCEEYYVHGLIHRDDGPARIRPGEAGQWYRNGIIVKPSPGAK